MYIAVIILAVMFGMMIPSAVRADRRAQAAQAAQAAELEAERRAFLGF